MRLMQKKFVLNSEQELTPLDLKNDEIILTINGHKTSITLHQVFTKINSIDKNKITGYSILEKFFPNMKIETEEYTINIGLYNMTTNQEIKIVEVTDPFFQFNDKEISDNEFKSFTSKLIELNAQIIEQESVQVEVESHPVTELVGKNEEYEKESAKLIKSGYKEYISGNYRLLRKEDDDVFVKLIDENNYEDIENGKYKVIEDELIVENSEPIIMPKRTETEIEM